MPQRHQDTASQHYGRKFYAARLAIGKRAGSSQFQKANSRACSGNIARQSLGVTTYRIRRLVRPAHINRANVTRLKTVKSDCGSSAGDQTADDACTDIEIVCNSDRPPLIPEGNYELGFVRAEDKAHLWGGRRKMFLHFQIVQAGEHFGKVLFMSANLPVNGRFSISSKFLQQWSLATGKQPSRHDRLSTRVFRGKVFLGCVRTVKVSVNSSTGKMQERDASSFYSVVDHLIEVRTGT